MVSLFFSFLLANIVFFVDRFTKYYVLHNCLQGCVINQFVSIQPLFNRGISWGMLHTANNYIFVIISCIIGAITVGFIFYTYVQWKQKMSITGELLVLVGSLSNIIDRVLHQGVVDFISLSFHKWSWPVFNVADTAIVIGIGIIIIQGYKKQ